MIGLLDCDWSLSTSNTFLIPNIEIMKLASYYKKNKNHFCRLLTFDDTDLKSYEKIYIFSELHPNLKLPDHFLRQDNIIFGGSAFTQNKYIPFENSVIDYIIPKPTIYKEVLKKKNNEGIKAKVISKVLDNTYYRNYAGENRLPLPAIIPKKQVILYDRDFFYPDWQDTIEEISSHKPSTILRIHPIICKTLTQYFTLRNYTKIARSNTIILDIPIPLEDINYMLNHYQKMFLADIAPSSNVMLFLGGTWPTVIQYSRDLIYKMNLLLSFWSKKIPIKLYYQEPNIGVTNPLEDLDKAIVSWTNAKNKDKTILDRIPKTKKNSLIEQQYKEVIKLYPSSKNLFEQSFNTIAERGFWNI